MNEKQAQALFEQFVNDGYDVSDLKTFKAALQEPKKAGELYKFFSGEGYDLGKAENFSLVIGQEPAVEATEEPAEAPVEEAAEVVPPAFEWGAPTDSSIIPAKDFAVSGAGVAAGEQAPVAPAKLSSELRDFYGDNLLSEKVGERFTNLAPQTKETLDQYLQQLPVDRQLALSEGEWTEKKAAGLAERAMHDRFQTLSKDFETINERLSETDPRVLESYAKIRMGVEATGDRQALDAFSQNFSQEDLQQFEQYYQIGSELTSTKTGYSEVISAFPEEAARRQKVKGSSERLAVSDSDTWWDATYKTAFNTGNTLVNRVLKGTDSFIMTPLKSYADEIKEDVGTVLDYAGVADKDDFSTESYTMSDQFLENFQEGVEELLLPENTKVFEKGRFQGFDSAIPATVGMLADMAMILGGASAIGGGGLGVVVSGGSMAYANAYNDAVDKDLSDADAREYATWMGVVQGSLELISPQTLTRSVFSKANMGVLMGKIKDGSIGRADIFKAIAKEAGDENIQELSQGLSEKLINAQTNAALGQELFQQDMTKDELYETIALTTAASLVMGGLVSGRALRGQQREAALVLSSKQKEFQSWLQENVESGKYTVDQANNAMEAVERAQELQTQAQAQSMLGKKEEAAATETEVETREVDGEQVKVPVAQEQAALDALEGFEQESTPEKAPQQAPEVSTQQRLKDAILSRDQEAIDAIKGEVQQQKDKDALTDRLETLKDDLDAAVDIDEMLSIDKEIRALEKKIAKEPVAKPPATKTPRKPKAETKEKTAPRKKTKATPKVAKPTTKPAPKVEARPQLEASERARLEERKQFIEELTQGTPTKEYAKELDAINKQLTEAAPKPRTKPRRNPAKAKKTAEKAPVKEELPPQQVIEPDTSKISKEPLSYERGNTLVQAKTVLDDFMARAESDTLSKGDKEAAKRAYDAVSGILPKRFKEQVKAQLGQTEAVVDTAKKKVRGKKAVKKGPKISVEEAKATTIAAPVKATVNSAIAEDATFEVSKKKAEVGDVVEFEGSKFFIKESKGGKFTLITPDGKGGAKGVTAKEIKVLEEVLPEVQEGDTIQLDGKAVTVKLDGDNYVVKSGKDTRTIKATAQARKEFAQAKRLQEKKNKLRDAKKAVAEQLGDQSLFSSFDPKQQAYRDTQFFKAMRDLAIAWIDYNGSVAYSKFKKSLPSAIRAKVADEILRDAFENAPNYEMQQLKSKDSSTDQAESNIGNKQSKGAQSLGNSVLLTDEQKAGLKSKGWNYWQRSLIESDDMAAAFINEMGIDQAYEDYIGGKVIPLSIRTFVGKTLIGMLNKNGDTRKASNAAQQMIADGRDMGRGLGAFRGLTMLTPEGLAIWVEKQVSTTQDKIKKRNSRKVRIAVAKLAKAKAAALQDPTLMTNSHIKAMKRKAWEDFKKAAFGSASSGLDPRAMAAAVKYAYYAVLDGANTIAKLRQKLPKVNAADLQQIWNTKVAGNLTVADIATQKHIEKVRRAIGTTRLVDVLTDLKVENPAKVAKKINTEFAKVVTANFKKVAKSNVDKMLLKELASRKSFDAGLAAVLKIGNEALADMLVNDVDMSKQVAQAFQLMQDAPFDFQKQEIAAGLANATAKEIGSTEFSSLAMSLWYASILSGPGTQILNIGSNVLNTVGEGLVQTPIVFATAGLRGNVAAVKGLTRGWSRGAREAKEIMAKGINPTRASAKFFEADPLEQYEFSFRDFAETLKSKSPKAAVNYLLGGYPAVMKYVPRTMAAADAFFYHGLYEAQASAYAVQEAQAAIEKDPSLDFDTEFARLMGWAENSFKASETIAREEATVLLEQSGIPFTESDVKRGARELITSRSATKDEAHRFASKGTFNYEPEGLLGKVANILGDAGDKIPPFKFIVPFTRIVANVLNVQLDYSPWGLKRAAVGTYRHYRGAGKNQSTNAKDARHASELLLKSMIGTFLLPMLASALAGEDEEGLPIITGRGPTDYAKRRQLTERGWKPYSILVDGVYFSYQYTQASIPLTMMGNMFDLERYTDMEQEEVYARSILNIAPAIFNMSFLKTLGDAMSALSEDDPTKNDLAYFLKSQAVRVPASFIPNFARSLDKATNPELQKDIGFKELVMRQVPFVRGSIKRPALDVFGQPMVIKESAFATFMGFSRFASKDRSDAFTSVLGSKNYIVPGIGNTTEINKVQLKETPELYYDYSMLVGRHFRKNVDPNKFKHLTPAQFKKVMDNNWANSRKVIKALLATNDTPEVVKLLKLGQMPY